MKVKNSKYFWEHDFWATSNDTGSRYLYFVEWLALIGWVAAIFLLVRVAALEGWI